MNITLYRYREDQFGTHGQIENANGDVICYTIERPWLNNQSDVSCIPLGTYQCSPHVKSNNGQECWILNDVPDRTGILIHTGNTDQDSEGCIIIGLMTSTEGVYNSEAALEKLHTVLPANFTLMILNSNI